MMLKKAAEDDDDKEIIPLISLISLAPKLFLYLAETASATTSSLSQVLEVEPQKPENKGMSPQRRVLVCNPAFFVRGYDRDIGHSVWFSPGTGGDRGQMRATDQAYSAMMFRILTAADHVLVLGSACRYQAILKSQ
jgi:hypothetical protein